VPNVRLVDADKEMLGVFTREEALNKAEAAGLDLVRYSALSLQG
jgi:translation initiation factor IF-3